MIKTDEALLNEFKGNLFEFLVASHIARSRKIESCFLKGLDLNLKRQLSCYESQMRTMNGELQSALMSLSKSTFNALDQYLPREITSVKVVGKISTGVKWSEADILVEDKVCTVPISLKLSKINSYVNTKSAGVKSFISKYFCVFEQANRLQEELNSIVDRAFETLGHELYEMEGLSYEGAFDERWRLSDRPGQLPDHMRKVIHNSYYQIIEKVYDNLMLLRTEDLQLFEKSLLPLIGVGLEEILQVTCFYRSGYQLGDVSIIDGSQLSEGITKIGKLKPGLSSFEIEFCKLRLQIRVKPMNKFTTPAFKINCSIRKKI